MRGTLRARTGWTLAGLLLVACAAPREPVREEFEEPAATPTVPSIRYTLELASADAPEVLITLEFDGDADGETELALHEGWAGLQETGKDLELVEARDESGAGLACERTHSFAWRVRHEPKEPLACTFVLGPTRHRANPAPPEYYLPLLEPGLFHAIGAQTLPAPAHLDGTTERAIELAWRGFEDADWRVVSSFGVGEGPIVVRRALDDFRHALFLAGDLRVLENDVNGRPLVVALHGEDWGFSADELAALASRIVALERDFFDDHERPYYLISAIGVGQKQAGSTSFGGTGLTDSFALFLTPGMDLAAGGPGAGSGIAWLLAHELFHDWNGHVIRLAQPEQLGYWFSEGFTDFYARSLLRRSGLLSLEEYVDSWNQKLASYATNPERNAPAERIREAFWTDRNVGELPYQRGDVVALFVDHAIREASGGARSLDDLMRGLVARARAGEDEFTNDELVAAIGELAGEEVAEAVRAVVVDGATVELPDDAGAPELELVPAEIALFDTGFDHERSIAEGRVCGVRAESGAARAGLVDGMKLASWSVMFGRADVPIEMRVRDGTAERTISFLPRGEVVAGQRFRQRSE